MVDQKSIQSLFEPTATQLYRVLDQKYLSDLDQELLLKVTLLATAAFMAMYSAVYAVRMLSAQLENPFENVFELLITGYTLDEKDLLLPPGYDGKEYLENKYDRELAKKADPLRERLHLYCREYIDTDGNPLPPGYDGKEYLENEVDRKLAMLADPKVEKPWLYSTLFHDSSFGEIPMNSREIDEEEFKEIADEVQRVREANFEGSEPEQTEYTEEQARKLERRPSTRNHKKEGA